MTPPEIAASASLEAQVRLQPKASQIFLVSLTCLAAVCVGCATVLLSAGNVAGWFVGGLVLPIIGAGTWGWKASQSDIDLQGAAPTILSLPDGTTLSTDSRSLRSNVAANALQQLIEAHHRKELPQADGLVRNGHVLPNSASEANVRVEQINQIVREQLAEFEALVTGSRQAKVTQDGSEAVVIPIDDEPSPNIGPD